MPTWASYGGAATLPLCDAALGAFNGGSRVQALNPGRALRFGGKAVAGDKSEDEIGSAAGEAPETLTALTSQHRLDFVGVVFEARNDLTAVAS